MGTEADLTATGREPLLSPRVEEDIKMDVGRDGICDAAQRMKRVRLDEADITVAQGELASLHVDQTCALLHEEQQVIEQAARRGVPGFADRKIGLADIRNDWLREHRSRPPSSARL